MDDLYALILAGGSGTRLWPKSRKKAPKHLLQLTSSQSMIQETAQRLNGLMPPDHIFVVTNALHKAAIVEQLPEVPADNVIAEPSGKNTAWAMGLGAYYIAKHNPNAVIVNLAADHVISDMAKFSDLVQTACQAAKLGDYLISIGIVPTMPHTGLGYIKRGDEFQQVNGQTVYKVGKFVEKPDLETAKEFVASGHYFWNANLYTWQASSIKAALAKHAPQVHAGLEKVDAAIGSGTELQVLEEVYGQAEDTQIDKGVSEKADNLLMIEGNFGWDDIGDWNVLYKILAKSKGDNVVLGNKENVMALDTSGSLIHTDGRLIATIGLTDVVIIDTPNALLVCSRDKAQDVKKIVEKLKEEDKGEYL